MSQIQTNAHSLQKPDRIETMIDTPTRGDCTGDSWVSESFGKFWKFSEIFRNFWKDSESF